VDVCCVRPRVRPHANIKKKKLLASPPAIMPYLWMKIVEGLLAIIRAAQRLTASISTRAANRRQKVQERPTDGPDHADDPAGEPSPPRSLFSPEFVIRPGASR
jgi:hypothetical protein